MDGISGNGEDTQVITEGTTPTESFAPPSALLPPALVPPAPTYDGAMPQVMAAPRAPRNSLALLGVILAVPFWPAGLVLSTFGLFNAVSRRTGKVMAVIGLTLSVVTGGAVIAALALANSAVSSSTALDPGCAAIESSLPGDMATLKTDTAGLSSVQDSAAGSTTSVDTVHTDLDSIESDVTTASGDATHAVVKNDLDAMNSQIQSVGTALTDVESHSTSSEGAAAAALTTLQTTDTHLDAVCATY
jgi:hypothetical protein